MALFIMDRFSLANLILEVKTVVLSALFSLVRLQSPDVGCPDPVLVIIHVTNAFRTLIQ